MSLISSGFHPRKSTQSSWQAGITKKVKEEAESALTNEELKSGYLLMKEDPSAPWKLRYLVLTNEQGLIYYKERGVGNEKEVKGKLQLTNFGVDKYQEDQNGDRTHGYFFKLNPGENEKRNSIRMRQFFFCAFSEAEMRSWVTAIQKSLQGTLIDKRTIEIGEALKTSVYTIPEEDIQIESEFLGKGGSGYVKKGYWFGITVAAKSLSDLANNVEVADLQAFFQEIRLSSHLRHPNIITVFGYCLKDNKHYLVTEFLSGGDLSVHIFNRDCEISLPLTIELSLSIVRGMLYLHSQGIIHRDLKPANILVEDLKQAKLRVSDFGLSAYQKPSQTIGIVGAPAYAAPELSSGSHNHKVDVYSFGISLLEMYSREPVWSNVKTVWEITQRVLKGERPTIPPGCPFDALIRSCWSSQNERPDFREVYNVLLKMKQQL